MHSYHCFPIPIKKIESILWLISRSLWLHIMNRLPSFWNKAHIFVSNNLLLKSLLPNSHGLRIKTRIVWTSIFLIVSTFNSSWEKIFYSISKHFVFYFSMIDYRIAQIRNVRRFWITFIVLTNPSTLFERTVVAHPLHVYKRTSAFVPASLSTYTVIETWKKLPLWNRIQNTDMNESFDKLLFLLTI